MRKTACFIFLLGAVLTAACQGWAEDTFSSAQVYVAYETVRPGERLPVAVKIAVAEGWHTYAREPGDSGMPPSITFSGPEGFALSEWRFPVPQSFTDSIGTSYGYENQVVLLSDVLIPETASEGDTIELKAELQWMICLDMCLFQTGEQTITLRVGTIASEPSAEWQKLLAESRWMKPAGENE